MPIQFEVYIAYYVSAEHVFTSKEEAEKWIAEQPGCGLNKDWFVKAIPLIGTF